MDERGFQMQHVVQVHTGFLADAPHTVVQGICLYHSNRLVKPFWKVYCSSTGKSAPTATTCSCACHAVPLVRPCDMPACLRARLGARPAVGRGVVGYLEVDFLEPTADWQDVKRTPVLSKLEVGMGLLCEGGLHQAAALQMPGPWP